MTIYEILSTWPAASVDAAVARLVRQGLVENAGNPGKSWLTHTGHYRGAQ